jgi:hypothetical protein
MLPISIQFSMRLYSPSREWAAYLSKSVPANLLAMGAQISSSGRFGGSQRLNEMRNPPKADAHV